MAPTVAAFDRLPVPRTVVRTSGNRKVGAHTVTTARERSTCPRDCDAWNVCYGSNVTQTGGNLFDNVTRAPVALTLTAARLAAAIGRGQTLALRFNVVGDFLTDGGTRVDRDYVAACNAAAAQAMDAGRPVWSYTHAWAPHPDRENVAPSDFVTADGRPWTVRASVASWDGARAALARGWAPAVIVESFADPMVGAKLDGTGPRVVACPAQVRKETTCETCGLCARPNVIVAFAKHGNAARKTALPVFSRVD